MTTLLTRPAPDHVAEAPPQPVATAPHSPPQAPTQAPPQSRPSLPSGRPAPARLVLTGALSRPDTTWLEPRLEQLVATGAPAVEVDLSGVTAMDGAVARLLLRTSWHLGDPARALLLLHPKPVVRRVLRFYGAGGLVVR